MSQLDLNRVSIIKDTEEAWLLITEAEFRFDEKANKEKVSLQCLLLGDNKEKKTGIPCHVVLTWPPQGLSVVDSASMGGKMKFDALMSQLSYFYEGETTWKAYIQELRGKKFLAKWISTWRSGTPVGINIKMIPSQVI